jgi:ABC-type uncharacterized transport system permease subunit
MIRIVIGLFGIGLLLSAIGATFLLAEKFPSRNSKDTRADRINDVSIATLLLGFPLAVSMLVAMAINFVSLGVRRILYRR